MPSSPPASSLAALIPPTWREAVRGLDGTLAALDAFLAHEAAERRVFPPREQIFQALALTPLPAVRAVVIGQDPYPTLGNANGLAFSVSPGQKVPASLKNIFAGLAVDLGLPLPPTGDLSPWARQGVLLLNTVLTVTEKAPNSHKKKGWEVVTQAILQQVDRQPGPIVFLCFGVHARAMAEALVDSSRHAVLTAPHPSPLNGKAFVQAVERERPFSRANQILAAAGRGTIDWRLG